MAEGMTHARLSERFDLLPQMDAHFQAAAQQRRRRGTRPHAAEGVRPPALGREPRGLRAGAGDAPRCATAYGRHKFGQSVLLARRLVEAGTRLVQVNWPREGTKEVGGSPLWDTHRNNAGRVRDVLCPQFDRTFATLIDDLAARGLARRNARRGHGRIRPLAEDQRRRRARPLGLVSSPWPWPARASAAGRSSARAIASARCPRTRPVRPPDLAATIFHLLGHRSRGRIHGPARTPAPSHRQRPTAARAHRR